MHAKMLKQLETKDTNAVSLGKNLQESDWLQTDEQANLSGKSSIT